MAALPTHNRRFAKVLTGDLEGELVNNLIKRIVDDRTGSRCGGHTKPFLPQTNQRDTSERMHDLPVPISVQGRHRGGVRIRYRATA